MSTAASAVLLVGALAGLVALRRVGFAAPALAAAVVIVSGLLSWHAALHALRPLLAPLAFVVLAVPLAVLLDELGFFEELARRVGESRCYLGACWILAALVTALLNLDAAVVLLTPLYLRIAERRRVSAVALCLQPLMLSCLASSALPISNLTNLIVAPVADVSTLGFLEHLGLPTLAATAVGWFAYRRVIASDPMIAESDGTGVEPRPESRPPAGFAGQHPLTIGGAIVIACVAGFLTVSSIGGAPWEVAAGGDLVLLALTRRAPLPVVPWRSVITVLGLGVLAAALALHLPIHRLIDGTSAGGLTRDVGVLTVGANVVNNLPALLVVLPALGHHAGWPLWAVLLGANIGPLALPTGTLAALLWLETVRRLGIDFGDRDYLRMAWKVALPALLAATAVLLGLYALIG